MPGSWWGLHAVFEQSRQEFESFLNMIPMSCPVDGEPLTPGPTTASGSGVERFCRFDSYRYPQDHEAPMRM